jgi:uncharacterized membrane protein (Fun14 family)
LVFCVVEIGGVLTLTGGFIVVVVLLLIVLGIFILTLFLKQNTRVTDLHNNYMAENFPLSGIVSF